jgi:hypothetical protein
VVSEDLAKLGEGVIYDMVGIDGRLFIVNRVERARDGLCTVVYVLFTGNRRHQI